MTARSSVGDSTTSVSWRERLVQEASPTPWATTFPLLTSPIRTCLLRHGPLGRQSFKLPTTHWISMSRFLASTVPTSPLRAPQQGVSSTQEPSPTRSTAFKPTALVTAPWRSRSKREGSRTTQVTQSLQTRHHRLSLSTPRHPRRSLLRLEQRSEP